MHALKGILILGLLIWKRTLLNYKELPRYTFLLFLYWLYSTSDVDFYLTDCSHWSNVWGINCSVYFYSGPWNHMGGVFLLSSVFFMHACFNSEWWMLDCILINNCKICKCSLMLVCKYHARGEAKGWAQFFEWWILWI
jgi:hypothetical protein